MSCLTCPGPTLASFPPLMSPPASGPASQPRDQGGGTPGITSHLYVYLGLVSQAEDEDAEATLEDKLVRMAQGDGNNDLMLKVLTHISFCTMHNVLSQALDHKLVLPVDCSGQPLKHLLLGAVNPNQAMEPRLLSPVDPLQHVLHNRCLEPRLGHASVHLYVFSLIHDHLLSDDGA